jgi:two-component system response regulator YesN
MKIMIVDDEVIIRTGLSTVIDWKGLGFTLLPSAASAEEALLAIELEQPHVLITDIKMTGKSGLDLVREVKGKYPDMEIIVLTGYDDFSFAQQALREGVGDFLLKTSRPEEIIKATIKAKQQIEGKWEAKKNVQQQQTALRDQLLERLVLEGLDEFPTAGEIMTYLPALQGEPDEEASYQVMIVAASGWGDAPFYANLLLFAVQNMLKELLACETMLNKEYLLVCLKNPTLKSNELRIASLITDMEKQLKCVIFLALGSCVDRIEDLKITYKEAFYVYSFKNLIEGKKIITYETILTRKGGKSVCSLQEETELAALLNGGSSIELRYWTNKMVNRQLLDPEITPISLHAFLNSIVISGHRWLERVLAVVGHSRELPEQLTHQTIELSNHMETQLIKLLEQIMSSYHESISEDKSAYIKRSIAYIQENLDKNVSLLQVSKFVHLHPNHFSEIFKRETGMTYIEFVKRERIHKAILILNETPAKISEVANQVGYEDIKYFSQLFKKYTGKTPSEFRQKP